MKCLKEFLLIHQFLLFLFLLWSDNWHLEVWIHFHYTFCGGFTFMCHCEMHNKSFSELLSDLIRICLVVNISQFDPLIFDPHITSLFFGFSAHEQSVNILETLGKLVFLRLRHDSEINFEPSTQMRLLRDLRSVYTIQTFQLELNP